MLLLGGAAMIIGIAIAGLAGMRLNLTPSYPVGLWRMVPKQSAYRTGDLVFVCPPNTPIFVTALERGYLPRGLCPGGTGPLIKTIAATSGQIVEIGATVMIDGQSVPNSLIRSMDASGRSLAPAAGGVVPAGAVFLLSDYSGSFDSRYFGPVPSNGILGLAQPVLIYAR
jgi:conjugative transfer signal peptidase TraF